MENEIYRYFVVHSELGYVRYSSYSRASPSDWPDPRGGFTRIEDAQKRAEKSFYYKGKKCDPKDLSVVEIKFTWEEV